MQRQLNPPVLTSQPVSAKTASNTSFSTVLKKPKANTQTSLHNFARMPIHALSPGIVQPKLKVNIPGDHAEMEADHIADKVVSQPDQSKGLKENVGPGVSQSGGFEAPPAFNHVLRTQKNNGTPMPPGVTSKMNRAFGFDFSSVRIHADSKSAKLSDSIQARAFTHGQDVYFNRGEYNPGQTEGSKLLAHELTHVVQQTSTGSMQGGPPQTIQRSIGGFFGNLWRSIATIFVDEPDYDDKTLTDYLAVLDSAKIEGDFDSDNKARVVVKQWKKGKRNITRSQKVWLIREMLDGATGDDDENAILDILKGSPGEMTYILNFVTPKQLREDFHGSEFKELDKMLKEWEKRTGGAKAEDVNPTDMTLKTKDELLGDGTEENPGLTLGEFESYIKQQANWFTEDTLKADEFIRNKLWDASVLITEGNHTRDSLGDLKLDDVVKGNEDDLKFLSIYAEGAKEGAQTVQIKRHLDDMEKAIKLGEAMKTLKSFLPGVIIQVAINESMLHQLVDKDLMNELIKYYKEWEPTFENSKEGSSIIDLLEEGVSTYNELKWWMRDLHIVTKATRLKLLDNIKEKSRPKPLLLVLMSAIDHNTAFLQGRKLEEAILNTKNLALLLQGQKSLKEFETKANIIADIYGLKPDAKSKGQIGQIIIAGHGNANLVELASSGKNPRKEQAKKGEFYVDYDKENLSPKSEGDMSEVLIDSLLKRMDPKDARIVFAGCLVGSHYTPSPDELRDTKKAAKVIEKSIKENPNLRDIVYQRMKKLNITGEVQAGRGSATFRDFKVDADGKAMISSDKDPKLGGSVEEYVQSGVEPEGALRAAVETWWSKGAKWTTDAMKKYIEDKKDNKDWWPTITRAAYEVSLMNVSKDGNVDPAFLSELSHRVSGWLDGQWEHEFGAAKLDKSLKPTERELVFNAMLKSNHGDLNSFVKIVIFQVWAKTDATKAALLLDTIDKDTFLKEERLTKLLDQNYVDPLLPTLMVVADPVNPTQGQLKLALAIAATRGTGMPGSVKKLLKDAAGNKKTTNFPAPLKVNEFLEKTLEITILNHIDLAPGTTSETPSAPEPSKDPKAPPKFANDANADLDADKKNESLVTVKPVKFVLRADSPVWDKASMKSNVIATLKKGTVVRVAGTFAGWAMIDLGGKPAFVDLTLVAELK
ncbi:MAG TPA: DUF4157 domain-containing protein [Saprospiraceae bacterium]